LRDQENEIRNLMTVYQNK